MAEILGTAATRSVSVGAKLLTILMTTDSDEERLRTLGERAKRLLHCDDQTRHHTVQLACVLTDIAVDCGDCGHPYQETAAVKLARAAASHSYYTDGSLTPNALHSALHTAHRLFRHERMTHDNAAEMAAAIHA